MASKRMFSMKIVDSDAFLDMSQTAQLLYFHLAMRSDDDWFVDNPKRIMKTVGSNEDDLKILLAKNFIIGFQNWIIVIKHHRINNNFDKHNCKRTQYLQEFRSLYVKENWAYTLDDSQWLPAQTELRLKTDWKQSLEENRIEENRRDNKIVSKDTMELRSKKEKISISKKSSIEKDTTPLPPSKWPDPEIDNIIDIIKSHNEWICDGTYNDQRRYWKLLIDKIKSMPKVADWSFTWEQFIDQLLSIISHNEFHSSKIWWPKKIYYELWTLIQVAKTKISNKKSKVAVL